MKSEDNMTTRTRQPYTKNLKAEAVRLVRDSAQPVAQVARNLCIADHLLYPLAGRAALGGPPGPYSPIDADGTGGTRTAETRKRDLEIGTGFITPCGGVLREGVPMRYRVIQEYDRRYPLLLMCRALAVSSAE